MLNVKNYSAGYKAGQYLFSNISFDLGDCEILGIKGSNGCGKSTFLKGLINLTPEKEGQVIFDGHDITIIGTSQIFSNFSIGYLSQRDRVFPGLTVEEHLKLFKYYTKCRCDYDSITHQLFEPLCGKEKMLAANLSGGEQLVLGLLGLSILNPKLILLDEPSDSLDVNHQDILLETLTQWKKSKSVIIVEQNISILNKIATCLIRPL